METDEIVARLRMFLANRAGNAAAKNIADDLGLCRVAMQAGHAAEAIPLLHVLLSETAGSADVAEVLGVALRMEQRLLEAEAVFRDAALSRPENAACAYGLAQTRFELGLPARDHFATAQQLLPDDPDIVRNRAAAIAAEGDRASAEALLLSAVTAKPDWIEGHKALATLRWTHGDTAHFADSYGPACAQMPGHLALWMGWFQACAQNRDWAGCRRILDQAEQCLGGLPELTLSRLFVASESGDVAEADRLFALTDAVQGDMINLTRIRHNIRQGRLKAAEGIALSLLLTRRASLFWPYLSLIWRLMGDERHIWIDRPDVLIRPVDVALTHAEFSELADVLRALHTLQRPYVEQSVRGGTQTDRSVILRHEPILQTTRRRWMDAIRGYIADLPPFEQGHPLLGTPRAHLLVEGSWSVRLARQGFNVPHTHPMGWLSTAFYIALPDTSQMGATPAGHIAFGVPPIDLGVDLPAYCTMAPRVGRCAVFPSTMWHSTIPFDDGERLVLAMDIRTPHH